MPPLQPNIDRLPEGSQSDEEEDPNQPDDPPPGKPWDLLVLKQPALISRQAINGIIIHRFIECAPDNYESIISTMQNNQV